jgi:hypothetical protein
VVVEGQGHVAVLGQAVGPLPLDVVEAGALVPDAHARERPVVVGDGQPTDEREPSPSSCTVRVRTTAVPPDRVTDAVAPARARMPHRTRRAVILQLWSCTVRARAAPTGRSLLAIAGR